mmetsp:Transcript_16184/g.33000  ORF Transcript_16184/g.33000 Transcript_16184/m.33000 type:complete len:270 (+) Transcript_16184:51-860(+)
MSELIQQTQQPGVAPMAPVAGFQDPQYGGQSFEKSSCRVFVGNLAWGVTWKELKDHFKTTGLYVAHADVLTLPDGRSKGCGIVELSNPADAAAVVARLNNSVLLGRQIFVREDRESGNRGGGGFQQQQQLQPQQQQQAGAVPSNLSCRVYVGNLAWEVNVEDLKAHLGQAGVVNFAEVMYMPDGRSKGCGIVEFSTAAEAQNAMATLHNTELKGRLMFVREDRGARSGGGGGGGGGGFAAGGGFGGGGFNANANLAFNNGGAAYPMGYY